MTTTHVQDALLLTQAKTATLYSIVSVEGHDDCSCRLHEIGVSAGMAIRIERAGNPAIVRIGSMKLALSRDCLKRIRVRECSESGS